MKPLKLIVSLAAAVCAFCTAYAQQTTTIASFEAKLTLQGPFIDGPKSTTAANINMVLTTPGLIAELGMITTNSFSPAAKLEVLGGPTSQFAVSDGEALVLIPTNIVSISTSSDNAVASGVGTLNTLHEKQLMVFDMNFNDVDLHGSDLQFTLKGIGTLTTVQTLTSTNISAKITMLGGGSKGGTNLVATVTMTGKMQ
jgi:hypothetical protein